MAYPDFIQFLLSSKPKFDCYFTVGVQRGQQKQERIGAVKLMLMAHSEVFRLLLEESELAEKEDVAVMDVHPSTFRAMLKYVYGHDLTAEMDFDEADGLLYVAEKYMMNTFKNKIATRLMKLLNTDNICSLLNNPAYYTHLELESAITQILIYETDRVLASPQFLLMNFSGFLKILEQVELVVPEIDLWRAAIKWGKHKAESEDGQLVRQKLSGLTQHLRICTLTGDQFFEEVATTGVLSREEMGDVCAAVGMKQKPEGLSEICNELVARKLIVRQKTEHYQLGLRDLVENWSVVSRKTYISIIITKKHTLELMSLVCKARNRQCMEPDDWTYKFDCSTTITRLRNQIDLKDNEELITVNHSQQVEYGVEFVMHMDVDGNKITLEPHARYSIRVKVDGEHCTFSHSKRNENAHLFLYTKCQESKSISPFRQLQYKALIQEESKN